MLRRYIERSAHVYLLKNQTKINSNLSVVFIPQVSYDQFDAACDDLAHGLEDAINKLGQQEEIWQQALDEVQKEIEGKVDKMEISPLKDFVNHRLKFLQDKLKRVAEARQDIEAAGTKKMLR